LESGRRACSIARKPELTPFAISLMAAVPTYLMGAGKLNEAMQMIQQALDLGKQPGGLMMAETVYPTNMQADIQREWNQLDRASDLIRESIERCTQLESSWAFLGLFFAYTGLMRISLSCGDLQT